MGMGRQPPVEQERGLFGRGESAARGRQGRLLRRGETAGDLRTLAATGASSSTRRTITGATSGALALLGALLGTAGAYAALLVWYRSDLSPLSRVPTVNLVVILAGLPLLAAGGGWLLGGREPPATTRQLLE